jgi:hypothetical protein
MKITIESVLAVIRHRVIAESTTGRIVAAEHGEGRNPKPDRILAAARKALLNTGRVPVVLVRGSELGRDRIREARPTHPDSRLSCGDWCCAVDGRLSHPIGRRALHELTYARGSEMRELVFRSALRDIDGRDPRTVEKSGIIEPIGFIEVHGRRFDVYSREGIDALIQNQKDHKMETTNINTAQADAWQAHVTQAISCYRDEGRALRDHQPSNTRQPDPAPVVHSPEPEGIDKNDPNYQFAKNRLVKITRPDGRVIENPTQTSATLLQIHQQPKPLPSVDDAKAAIDALRNGLEGVLEGYHAHQAGAAERHRRLIELGNEIAPLAERLARLQAEVDSIKNRPAPEVALYAKVEALERQSELTAGEARGALLELRAQSVFDIGFMKLSQESRNDLLKGLMEFQGWMGPTARQFAFTQQKTVEIAKRTLDRLTRTAEEIATTLKTKLNKLTK